MKRTLARCLSGNGRPFVNAIKLSSNNTYDNCRIMNIHIHLITKQTCTAGDDSREASMVAVALVQGSVATLIVMDFSPSRDTTGGMSSSNINLASTVNGSRLLHSVHNNRFFVSSFARLFIHLNLLLSCRLFTNACSGNMYMYKEM